MKRGVGGIWEVARSGSGVGGWEWEERRRLAAGRAFKVSPGYWWEMSSAAELPRESSIRELFPLFSFLFSQRICSPGVIQGTCTIERPNSGRRP